MGQELKASVGRLDSWQTFNSFDSISFFVLDISRGPKFITTEIKWKTGC